MSTLTYGTPPAGLTTDDLSFLNIIDADVVQASASSIRFRALVSGGGFSGTLDALLTGSFVLSGGDLASGTITALQIDLNGVMLLRVADFSLSVADFVAVGDDVDYLLSVLLAGDDSLIGGALGEFLGGLAGADTVSGGAGNDTIEGGTGASYLRGDDGNDVISGGEAFDDINGNQGDDTASGGLGSDWVVGGKDNDSLSGDAGVDIVYGNLGNDTCDGGADADLVRGGQGDDLLFGQAGDDWLSGDRGNDTLSGGAGADIFHSFGDAGIDRVTDFNRAQGDRVLLDPGTVYTVSQSGADVVIAMTGGGQMILVGVQQSALTGDWIFGA